MLDYPALAALAAVIREGSFERGAETLGITPSALSQRIRGFEERLGAILVVRAQPCRPTELGHRLCTHFDQVRLLEGELALAGDGGPPQPPTLKIAVNADSLATWFPAAAAAFAAQTDTLLDLILADEAHTADHLRSGDVFAAVSADPGPVLGCRTTRLGTMRFLACASPAFAARHFASGVDAATLAAAPVLRFERRDRLQIRWARETLGIELRAPTHWVPSTQGFLDLTLAGLAWGLQPQSLAEPHLEAGRLVELPPRHRVAVDLHWTVTRLHARSLRTLTAAVRSAAEASL